MLADDGRLRNGRRRPVWRKARSIRREAEDLVDAYERADRSFFAARKFETMRSSFRDFGSKIRRLEDSLEDLEGGRDW